MKYESVRDGDVSDLLLTCKRANAPQPNHTRCSGRHIGKFAKVKRCLVSCLDKQENMDRFQAPGSVTVISHLPECRKVEPFK